MSNYRRGTYKNDKMKESLMELGRLRAQRKQLDNQINKILKDTDDPVDLGDGFFQRRNILFVDFSEFGEVCSKNDLDVSIDENLDISHDTSFPSSCSEINELDEDATIDAAIKYLDNTVAMLNMFRANLDRAKDSGCEYLVDYGCTEPKDFDFNDDDDDDDN